MKSTANPLSTLLEQGRFTLENSTAIVTHGTSINYASMSELCRNNGLDLIGAAFSVINIASLEEEVLLIIFNLYIKVHINFNLRQYLH